MLDPAVLPYIFLGLIFLAAGFTQGVSGFGAGLLAMPLLTMFLDIRVAVPLCMLNGLLITCFLSLQLKSHIDRQKIKPLFIGCIPGIFVGVFLLKATDGNLLKIMLGCLITAYSLYRLLARSEGRGIHRGWAYPAGLATGVIGGAFSAGGPPTIIYVSLTDWKKDEIKATLSLFFFSTGVITSVTHAASGLIDLRVLHFFAASAVFTVAGVYLGALCYNRIAQKTYIRVMLLLLVAMGVMMIVAGLAALSGQ